MTEEEETAVWVIQQSHTDRLKAKGQHTIKQEVVEKPEECMTVESNAIVIISTSTIDCFDQHQVSESLQRIAYHYIQ